MARPDTATVGQLIATQFPQWAGLSIVPVEPGGWDNWTYRLGDDLVVRMPSAERYAAAVARERRWLPVLAEALPIAAPHPVAAGVAGRGYPFEWAVLNWVAGEPATAALATNAAFAEQLATVLSALHRVNASEGPTPGPDNFHRGGALATYDSQVRAALDRLDDPRQASETWRAALDSVWRRPPVWVHGDIAPGNLILAHGHLAGVIDWGGCAVGDPACDLAIAWSFLRGDARSAFRAALPLDDATWDRARGWALWKALVLATGLVEGPAAVTDAPRVLREIIG